MRKIGIDRRDIFYRHFYFDDNDVLASNPPRYKIWYVDDENDIDYIDCSEVIKIKDAPVTNENKSTIDINNEEKAATPLKSSDDKVSTESINEQSKPKKRGRKKKSVGYTDDKIENTKPIQTPISSSSFTLEPSNLKFEYKAFTVDFSSIQELVNTLNEYGEDGWELCSSELYSEGVFFDKKKVFCIMKKIKGLE